MAEKFYFETADVARCLGVTVAMVRVYVRAGRLLPGGRTPRGTRLFRVADVKAFQQAREEGNKYRRHGG